MVIKKKLTAQRKKERKKVNLISVLKLDYFKANAFSLIIRNEISVLFYDIKITKRGRKIQTLSRYCISLSRPFKKSLIFSDCNSTFSYKE